MNIQNILAPFHLDCESAWLAIDFATQLQKSNAKFKLWSTHKPINLFESQQIETIRSYQGVTPYSGSLTIVGTDAEIGSWYLTSKINEVKIIYHQHSPKNLYKLMHLLSQKNTNGLSIDYTDTKLKEVLGIDGEIRQIDFNPQRFLAPLKTQRTPDKAFTLGRIGRDSLDRNLYSDCLIYKSLADKGYNIELAGSLCLNPWLSNEDNIKLRGALLQSEVADYLSRIDCLYYRAGPTVYEQIPTEIRAGIQIGMPLVVYSGTRCIDIVKHSKNTFFFDSSEDAIEIIEHLAKVN